jgi:hypothetical protein
MHIAKEVTIAAAAAAPYALIFLLRYNVINKIIDTIYTNR